MRKRAKNEVFDQLIEFGWFHWSDIAYFVRYNGYISANSNEGAEKCHYLCLISIIIQ